MIETLNAERFCDKAPAQVWATCWTRAPTWPRSPPCTACCGSGPRCGSAGPRPGARPWSSRSWWRPTPTRSGAGTSPSWPAPTSGPGSSSTRSSTSTAATWWGGWCAPKESATLAEQLIADAIYRHEVPAGQLTLHADRGSSMTSRTVSQLLCDLGVLQSHSRPHVSNDNPYSEAQFKTLKYSPTFPKRFANIAAARSFCDGFFEHYNNEHRHSGIGLHTPADVHFGHGRGGPGEAPGRPRRRLCGHAGTVPSTTPGAPGSPRSSGSTDPRRRRSPSEVSEQSVSHIC